MVAENAEHFEVIILIKFVYGLIWLRFLIFCGNEIPDGIIDQ